MFLLCSISRGQHGSFLMYFLLFIQHLLDNIGASSQVFCHIGSRLLEQATAAEAKGKKQPCWCTFSLDWISVCIKTNANFIIVVWECFFFVLFQHRLCLLTTKSGWNHTTSFTMMDRHSTNSLQKVRYFPSSTTNGELSIYID